ncbi:MAG: protein-glutamine glutaminase family protein [Alphaproteobacteria bacterium]|nr:protein-glutamine glutaminase family protein [Alphaproteobacteria bacterium]
MGYRNLPPARKPPPPLFSGGDREVGAPAYRGPEGPAYSREQAKIIFENLMDARIDGKPIPFISNYRGHCIQRKELMLWHMVYHQGVDPAALGAVVSDLSEIKPQLLANYPVRVAQTVFPGQYTIINEEELNGQPPEFMEALYAFHIAPAIKVHNGSQVIDYVIDPAICANPATLDQWMNAHTTPVKPNKKEAKKTVPVYYTPLDKKEMHHVHGDSLNDDARDFLVLVSDHTTIPLPSSKSPEENEKALEASGDINDIIRAVSDLKRCNAVQSDFCRSIKKRGSIDLPNCGPRALKAVLEHTEGKHPEKMSPEAKASFTRFMGARNREAPTLGL